MPRVVPRAAAAVLAWLAFALSEPLASQPPLAPGPEAVPTREARSSVPGPDGPVVEIYRRHCIECHDRDGKGTAARDLFPKVPDFTDARWHASRSDADFGRSILEGKGKSMPRMKSKLGSVDVSRMVRFVRAFRDGKQLVDEEPDGAEVLAPASPVANPAPHSNANATRPEPSAIPTGGGPSARLAEATPLFKRLCAMCHGAEGNGERVRDSMPAIPNFTRQDWQARRRDPQLVVSILDGKGTGMPAFRGKIRDVEARALVALIRSLGPARPAVTPTTAGDDFEARFRALQDRCEDLAKQVRALSERP